MPISTPRPPHRLERLRGWLEDQDLDAAVVLGADNVNHLCGYWRYFGGPSALVVGRDGERTLVVMADEAPIAEGLSDADRVVGFGARGFGFDLDPIAGLVETVSAVPAVARAGRVGIGSELPGADARLGAAITASVVDASSALHGIRLIKDWDEIEKIGAGYELCWLGQQAVADGAVPGTSEIELYTAAQSTAQIASGGPIEFVCDLLSGTATADVCCPVHVAGTRRLEHGDGVIADVVVRTAGYWGDSCATYVVGENADAEAARSLLLDVLERARQELVPGATGADVFAGMSERISDGLPDGELRHHGGHALGLTGFEDPHVIPGDTMPLEPWMVLAIEPGVYVEGRYGARVENVFVVTPEGGVELRAALAEERDGR
jgi:Xaa-Pro aminopeptidase